MRVLVASPHPLLCAGLRATLEAERQIIVVGEASACSEASRLYAELGPDALILDTLLVEFPTMTALAELCSNSPKATILAIVGHHDIAAVPGLVALGVSGCILKEERADVLVPAITGVAAGATWFSPAVLVALARESPATKATLLTNREQVVMLLLAEGCRNSEIADTLGISLRTAEFHVRNVLSKLHARSRAEAVLLFQRHHHFPPLSPVEIRGRKPRSFAGALGPHP